MKKVDFLTLDPTKALPHFHTNLWQCYAVKNCYYLVNLQFCEIKKVIVKNKCLILK